MPELEAVIGLEIHVQLATRTKMFCGCALSFGDEPNVHTCPICLAHPGVLPVPNEEAIRFANGVDFQIGDLSLSHQAVTVLPFASTAVEGFDEQAMLGFELARRFVTVIDYGAKTITFIDPARFDPRDAGTPVPFAFYNHLPQVDGVFEGVRGRFNIDTGSRVELTLNKPFVELLMKSPPQWPPGPE